MHAAAALLRGSAGLDVDVSPFTDGATADVADQRSTADSWDATFCEVGFARIIGHGVPAELVAEVRAAARAFFFKPEDEKMRYHRPATTHSHAAGSFVPLWSSLAQGGHDDPLEGYTFHRPQDGWLHLDDPALDHPPEIASAAARYGHALEEVSHTLHRLSAAALQLPPDYFDTPAGTHPASLLVLSHYPPLSDGWAREADKPRYRAHSDYTGFTLLLQDEADHGGPGADTAAVEADGLGSGRARLLRPCTAPLAAPGGPSPLPLSIPGGWRSVGWPTPTTAGSAPSCCSSS